MGCGRQRRFASRIIGVGVALIVGVSMLLLALASTQSASGAAPLPMKLKTEHFDVDPNWDGHNNRATTPPALPINQNFGFSASTNRAGGSLGEISGSIVQAGELAYYAKDIGTKTFDDPFTVSGTMNVAGQGNSLLGFFNSGTANEWRMANSLMLRLESSGGPFFVHPEYATSKWRASASGFPTTFTGGSSVHSFSMNYDPAANGGAGAMTVQVDGQVAVANIDPGHRADGATFNRFGLVNVMKHAGGSGVVSVDDLNINGVTENFNTNPNWIGFNNRRSYLTTDVRPRFNFGYSATANAGGAASGEMGGLIFRGESDEASMMAYYGDRLEQTLTLDNPLHASGTVSFHRGVTDSASLIGFFNSTESMRVGFSDYSTPENFLGAGIEGPTAEGFFFYPSFNADIEDGHGGTPPPYIYPDRQVHDWALDYDPNGGNGFGRLAVSLDGQISTFDLTDNDRRVGARFDRFGMITPQKSGNGQRIFYDDLTYTIGVPEPAAIAPLAAGLLLLMRRRRSRAGGVSAASAAAIAMITLCGAVAPADAAGLPPMKLKTEHFDTDPGWDGRNNRVVAPGIPVNQNFGFSATANRAGGAPGEIGGFVTPAGEAAFYAKDIGTRTFDDPLSFSGTFNATNGAHVLIGFFNSNTVKEWRTPNSLAVRIDAADGLFDAHPEYGTSKWRASASSFPLRFTAGNVVHTFSFTYDPAGNGGSGSFITKIDDKEAPGSIAPAHRTDGAVFNRFGILNVLKHHDTPGTVAIDNLVLNNGAVETFTTDPGWQGFNNRRSYLTQDVRPRFNFGYSAGTSKAGGQSPGEMGGATFRGDSTNASVMAYYGDRLEGTLTLDNALHASGKVAFHRGVSDSAALIGFFHSTESMRTGDSDYMTPENFVGAVIEGPSSDGFFFYPSFNTDVEDGRAVLGTLPYIHPDGASHDWSLDYDPTYNGNRGRITLTLDGQATTMELTAADRALGARFDRFGMITTHKDGNGQTVFFDDLTYTVGIPEPGGMVAALAATPLLMLRRRRRRENAARRAMMIVALLIAIPLASRPARAVAAPPMKLKTEHFDTDPGWDGHNNRATTPLPQDVTQNFGYSASSRIAGGTAGEVGGFITPAIEPAFYGKILPNLSFDDPFSVSGNLAVQNGGGHTLIGLFNANTVNEWRTPNTIALRVYGRGSYFVASPEMATSKWRAGASFYPGTGDEYHFPTGFLTTTVHPFSLTYTPNGTGGLGEVTATIDGQTSGFQIDPSVRADGATFNRFGFLNVMKSLDSPGRVWLDNLTINGQSETFDANPNWHGFNNQRTYTTTVVRPRFDFGYSGGTSHAGGAAPGEMGGIVWRGDSETAGGVHMAYYGDRLEQTLDLSHPLHASGKVAFHRGVSDSATLIGFFHSQDSMRVGEPDYMTPEHFVGGAIEGPSSEGFYFYPTFMTNVQDGHGDGSGAYPYIYPDGDSHDWSLDYDPSGGSGGFGRITLALDGQFSTIDLTANDRLVGAHFDRFGIVTTHVDGLSQTVYFDDLTYTVGVPEPSSAAVACLIGGSFALARRRRTGGGH